MIINVLANGDISNILPENFNQGSNKANTIYVIAPFSANVIPTITFELPQTHETKTVTQFDEPVEINTTLNVWEFQVEEVLTQYYGIVKYQVKFDNGTQTIAVAEGSFKINKGLFFELPEKPDENVYQLILSKLSDIRADFLNGWIEAQGIRIYNETFAYSKNAFVFGEIDDEIILFKSLVNNNMANHLLDKTKWQNTGITSKSAQNLIDLLDAKIQELTGLVDLKITEIKSNEIKIQDGFGGFAGGNAKSIYGGGALGLNASSEMGGAIGVNSTAQAGGAVGAGAVAEGGAAVGAGARTSKGAALGDGAKTIKIHTDNDGKEYVVSMDAIQLGRGENLQEKTLQVYDDNIYNAKTHTLNAQHITVNGVNVALLTDLLNYYNKTEVDQKISQIKKFKTKVVSVLPTEDIEEETIYLVKLDESSPDMYEEYIYVDGLWELLGRQSVNLVDYVTLDTDQEITGVKTFKYGNTFIRFSDGLDEGDIVPAIDVSKDGINYVTLKMPTEQGGKLATEETVTNAIQEAIYDSWEGNY